ncbi:ABC transporter permease [Cumulibacter soli]|uniref:ABC transporter permease n=1 Tax=Cumulibacter soli TaxID=2546344 RepID=UPI0010682F73|nr:ABC transporter permease [Cumulibacter soli]
MFVGMIARRMVSVLPTLLLASILVFMLIQIIPGDPAVSIAGESATEEQVEAIRQQLGLDRPLVEQYGSWLGGVLQGDLGQSLFTREAITPNLIRTVPITLTVVLLAFVFALVFGIVGGIVAGWRANRVTDRVTSAAFAVGHAMPSFWLGLILVVVFALNLAVLPASGSVSIFDDPAEAIRYSILPAVAMGVVGAAEIGRQVRGAMITALQTDSVRTLYAKGLSQRRIVWHAFRNSAVPTLTIAGLVFNQFLGATVVIEAVFGMGGLGGQIMHATLQKDYPIIQGIVLVTATMVIIVNLIVDILYRVVDPRTR